MTTTTQPQAPVEEPKRPNSPGLARISQDSIAGRFTPITTHQFALIWWLYRSGHITRRQLRITFAAFEMRECRRYTSKENRGRVQYGLEELKGLVGGQRSQTASRDLSADVKRLGELVLVVISKQSISFADTAEQIRTDAPLDDFWAFYQALPNRRRTVPMPRRTLRALAAGFGKAETAYIMAALMRSVFWSKKTGKVTTDGRVKLAWVATTFGISRRAATGARARLIELGWLLPLETQVWERNKWGVRDAVQVDWAPSEQADEPGEIVDNPAVGEGQGSGESASPPAELSGEFASPCLNRSSLSTRDLKTRRLGCRAPSPSGVSGSNERGEKEPRRRRPAKQRTGKPNIRDVQAKHLGDPKALLELHRQAVALGLADSSQAGELEFFSMANRARSRGRRPGALFYDLVKNKRSAFITIADEDAARRQLRELREGPVSRMGIGGEGEESQENLENCGDRRIVLACLRLAPRIGVKERPGETAAFWRELFQKVKGHLPAGWGEDRWMNTCLTIQ